MSFISPKKNRSCLLTGLSRPTKIGSWTVSLGDLLTLLLCFILSLVSYGHIKPIPKETDVNKISNNQAKLEKNEADAKKSQHFGSPLASYAEQEVKKVFFDSSDFTSHANLRVEAREELGNFVEDNALAFLTVRVCSDVEYETFEKGVTRVMSLRKAILAKQFERSRLRVEFLGEQCQRLNKKRMVIASIEARMDT